jgi:hypothetical protein
MARRKAERPAESGVRRAETKAVAAYLTAIKAPKGAGTGVALEKRRAQIKQWIAGERDTRRPTRVSPRRTAACPGKPLDPASKPRRSQQPRWAGHPVGHPIHA